MTQTSSVKLGSAKMQAILEAGEKQLSVDDFKELTELLFDLEVYGLTPWINTRLGTLMSKITWELPEELAGSMGRGTPSMRLRLLRYGAEGYVLRDWCIPHRAQKAALRPSLQEKGA